MVEITCYKQKALLNFTVVFLLISLIGAEDGDSCGESGTGETPQVLAPRRLTARPAESVRPQRNNIAKQKELIEKSSDKLSNQFPILNFHNNR